MSRLFIIGDTHFGHDKSALGLGYTCVSAERINFTPIEFKQGIHEHNK